MRTRVFLCRLDDVPPWFRWSRGLFDCEYDVPLHSQPDAHVSQIVHHGVSYAETLFPTAVRSAYIAAAGAASGYVSAYTVRAIVCVELRIPLAVFARSLESLIAVGPLSEITVYTELPFEPPPQGESYVWKWVSGESVG
jgi:hypothetical protein